MIKSDFRQQQGHDDIPVQGEDRGIALLMALGTLSVLLVLSLSFALTTMNSMKSVELSQDVVKSRLITESGFQKAYTILASNFADPNFATNLFPGTKPNQVQYIGPQDHPTEFNTALFDASDWAGRAYWFSVGTDTSGSADTIGIDSALHVTMANKNFTSSSAFTSMMTSIDPDNQFGWTHILDGAEKYPGNDTPIIARIAYIIVDESGKIDPWAACSVTVAEGSENRIGRNISEINLVDLVGGTMAAEFEYASQGGFASDTYPWSSYYNIYKTFQSNGHSLADTEVALIQQNLFPHSYDTESFFDGTGDKHRFNVGEIPGDPDFWDNLPMPKINRILTGASNFSGTSSGGIDWLSVTWSDVANSDTPIAAQVAANIIDYCDDDSNIGAGISQATSDYNVATFPIPTYCGNEMVPYLSEIRFQLDFNPTTTLTLSPNIELINMFQGVALSATGKVTMNVQITGTDITGTIDDTLTFTWNFTNIFNAIPAVSVDYYNSSGFLTAQNVPTYDGNGTISNVQVQVVSAIVQDSTGNLWDFSTPGASAAALTTSASNNFFITVEVDDPRSNLDASNWAFGGWGNNVALGHTIGSVNSVFTLNTAANVDQEPATVLEPWQVSTNFIRNAPMMSLWELGAIHRGQAWRTLNIGTYNNIPIGAAPTTGIGIYASGDANILDHTKLGEDTEVHGKININTYNNTVLAALFNSIEVENDYNNSLVVPVNNQLGNITGTSATVPTTLATNVQTQNGTNGGEPFWFRGKIATIIGINDASIMPQSTDRAKEEVIGKVANLLTVRQNYFTIITTSQVIRDMLDGYKSGHKMEFNDGIDKILAQQRLFSIIYRDAINNDFTVIRYEYLNQ